MNIIYVKLLNEGVDVWRPVAAEMVNENIYKIIAKNVSYDEKCSLILVIALKSKNINLAMGKKVL